MSGESFKNLSANIGNRVFAKSKFLLYLSFYETSALIQPYSRTGAELQTMCYLTSDNIFIKKNYYSYILESRRRVGGRDARVNPIRPTWYVY